MQITEEMLQAAMKKAVETGLVPKHTIDEETYLRNWGVVKAVVQAALDVTPAK